MTIIPSIYIMFSFTEHIPKWWWHVLIVYFVIEQKNCAFQSQSRADGWSVMKASSICKLGLVSRKNSSISRALLVNILSQQNGEAKPALKKMLGTLMIEWLTSVLKYSAKQCRYVLNHMISSYRDVSQSWRHATGFKKIRVVRKFPKNKNLNCLS